MARTLLDLQVLVVLSRVFYRKSEISRAAAQRFEKMKCKRKNPVN
jgi:hypothetical protein